MRDDLCEGPGDREGEASLDPGQPIVDPHHHLWDRPGGCYLLADTASGHDIRATVFGQCGAMHRADGPPDAASGSRRLDHLE